MHVKEITVRPRRSLAVALEPASRDVTRHLGEYELIAELARGGMGRIFLARRQGEAGFERLYAIKVMHDHLADEPEAVTMLIDEANIASRLHHPNVISTVDMGIHEGRYYIVMEYVEGPTLSELFRRTKWQRPVQLIIPLLLDALRGLHAAHELADPAGRLVNLIHRDFSPQNLLVGLNGACLVSDFGIAKARARLTKTRPNLQKGKISYMSPEQLVSNDGLDRRVDIWAAGVVLWQALTGLHPFLGPSHAATIHLVLQRRVPPPSTIGLRPPRCFDRLCMRALSREREDRFNTAREMADELQRVAVRQDLLGPQSEVADWIKRVFDKEIEQRRTFLKAFMQKSSEIACLATPIMPQLSSPPSPIPRPVEPPDNDEHQPTIDIHVPKGMTRSDPVCVSVQDDRDQRRTPRRPRRRVERDDAWLKALVGVTIGVIVGFTLCIALLSSLRQHRATMPQPPTVQTETVQPQAPVVTVAGENEP